MSGIRVSLDGFEEYIKRLEQANKNVDAAIRKAVDAGADAADRELHAQCDASGVPSSVSREIKKTVESAGNRYRVKVGWEIENYDPKNPSQGYKALFLNYGTPHRKKHGKVKARGFIAKAKKNSKKKIKEAQQAALDEIIGGL